MITVNLKGGLGNQMFQYACGRALSLRNNTELILTRSEYQGDTARSLLLSEFNIQAKLVNKSEVPRLPQLLSRIKQKITRDFQVKFDPKILNLHGQVYLDGYFQSEKYFADYSENIRKEFILTKPLSGTVSEIETTIKSDGSAVSLHCRRGDYTAHPDFGGIADVKYYERAVSKLQKLVPEAHFYIFSDDIVWCQTNLTLPVNTVFVSKPNMKDYEELWLMSRCRHQIIANSSFSWWGAWLNPNPDKIVVAPNRWSNIHENWYRDIIPSKWYRI